MANTRGGLIIFGVQDKTTAVVGIDPDEVNWQQYAQWIRNHVQPYLQDLDIFELTDGTKTVLVVDVPASEMAPHFVYGGAARDKEQQAAVVPYRDNDHTAWMPEHQIERAYRDRFARVGHAEEEIQRHIDFTTQTIIAHAYTPSAWFFAVSRPQRPLPRGAYAMKPGSGTGCPGGRHDTSPRPAPERAGAGPSDRNGAGHPAQPTPRAAPLGVLRHPAPPLESRAHDRLVHERTPQRTPSPALRSTPELGTHHHDDPAPEPKKPPHQPVDEEDAVIMRRHHSRTGSRNSSRLPSLSNA
ncbi:putative DNA binding domain-containing protein [Streptomyces sp. 5-8]|uniref:DNA binding domain-containing protein n=1 Tax=Streptomyces musisoli TaxID=2802280 RepID=A0ABS1PD31_9ACTN|nr:putative DNA binding domain-containing protein [Streptomyces musisoli]MBY8846737.1 putative DNA binding domain-containing protein [Streptomyces sp. SP2-10]